MGSFRDREVACSASDRQGSNYESCVWRTVSSQSSHHPQEVLLAQFSLYVHKGGLKPDSFHFISPDIQASKHDTLKQCWYIFGSACRRWPSIIATLFYVLCRVCCAVLCRVCCDVVLASFRLLFTWSLESKYGTNSHIIYFTSMPTPSPPPPLNQTLVDYSSLTKRLNSVPFQSKVYSIEHILHNNFIIMFCSAVYSVYHACAVIHPSSHITLNQCWFYVGPPSATLDYR